MSIDFSFDAPDFVVTGQQPLCIEATIASNADGRRPEWEQTIEELTSLHIKGIVDEATVRIANAVASKHKKYQSRYSKLAHVTNKPFIIAVATLSSHMADFKTTTP